MLSSWYDKLINFICQVTKHHISVSKFFFAYGKSIMEEQGGSGGGHGPLVISYKTEISKGKRSIKYTHLNILHQKTRTKESESYYKS